VEAFVIQCERLEYGKFVDSDLTAEMMEHAVLAISRDFPEGAKAYCGPRVIGPCLRELESRPPWASEHGTVLAPVATSNGTCTVLARVKEQAEGHHVRNFQRARFLAVYGLADPGALFQIIQDLPWIDYQRGGGEFHSIGPVELTEVQLQPSPLVAQFLRKALPYSLMGVPLWIDGEISEREFFSLAQALWKALPRPLQRCFSAGWGTGESTNGKFTMSAGYSGSSYAAEFQMTGKVWIGPSECQISQDNWQWMERLAAFYVRSVHGGDAAEPANPEMRELIAQIAGNPPALAIGPVYWDAQEVMANLRYAAGGGADAARLKRFRQALSQQDLAPLLPDRNRDDFLLRHESMRACIQTLCEALPDPTKQSLAVRALARWSEAERALASDVFSSSPQEVKAHLRGFQHRTQEKDVLERLARGDDSDDLSPAEMQGFAEALRARLAEGADSDAKLHARILEMKPLSTVYRLFLESSAWDVALLFDRSGVSVSPLLFTEDPRIKALHHLAHPFEPGSMDVEAFAKASDGVMKQLQDRIAHHWQNQQDREDRGVVLKWALQFKVKGILFVQLIERHESQEGSQPLGATWVEVISQEVTGSNLPKRAERAVADAIERYPSEWVEPILRQAPGWARIGPYLKSPFRWLLFGYGDGPVDSQWQVTFAPRGLELLFEHWSNRKESMTPEVASALHLAAKAAPSYAAVQTTSYVYSLLYQGIRHVVKGNTNLDIRTIEAILAVHSRLPEKYRLKLLPQEQVDAQYWGLEGERFLLFALLFPDCPLPSLRPSQLTTISKHRRLVREYVKATSEHSRRLRWLAAEFHEHTYQAGGWVPDGVVWAIIGGLELRLQRDLRSALVHFSADLREQIRLCENYMDAMESTSEVEGAVERVRTSFVIPVIHDQIRSPLDALNRLENKHAGTKNTRVQVAEEVFPRIIKEEWQDLIVDAGFFRLVGRLYRLAGFTSKKPSERRGGLTTLKLNRP